jgi:endonuclease G, mitochondrial
MSRKQTRLVISILVLVVVVWKWYQRTSVQRPPAGERTTREAPAAERQRTAPSRETSGEGDVSLLLGNPSDATVDLSYPDNYLVERPQFALSYNRTRGGPNWVSWHVQRSDLGSVERTNSFMPDPLLPEEWQIRPSDYAGSGYDRGHMCPSGDRTRFKKDNEATFVMANMLPQAGDLNRHVWEGLEAYCRDRVLKDEAELYIVAGGRGKKESIAQGKVTVPEHCWKVVVVLPEGEDDLQRIDRDTRVIAVDMPNREGISSDPWQKYLTTVRAIEAKASTRSLRLNLLSNLPNDIQATLESRKDTGSASDTETVSDEARPRRKKR